MRRVCLVVVLLLVATTAHAGPHVESAATPFCWDEGAAQQHRFICGENCGD